MNILLFTLEYPPFKGGIANYYDNMVKYWPAEGIFVLNNNDGALVNDKLPLLKWLPSIFKLRREIKNKRINHVIVGHILPLGTAALVIRKIKGTPYSVILHGMDLAFAMKAGCKKWLAKKILKNASYIICASSFTAEMARAAVGVRRDEALSPLYAEKVEKIGVVNPGVSRMSNVECRMSNKLIDKYNLKDKIILFSIGRLVKRKGFDKVIEAMPAILKEAPNLVYIIAGTGPDEEYLRELKQCHCEEAVAATGDEAISESSKDIKTKSTVFSANRDCFATLAMTNNIIFLGKITDEEKWAWLELCDIFTMPSRQIGNDFEGFGIVYLEAGLAGKPIVAGRSGGVEDAVVDGETGLLVNPESAEEITNTIIKLAKDRELRKKLGEAGKKRAEEEFSWKKQVKKICYIINKG